MSSIIRLKLFLMMFLEFFIWGAWLPLVFGYLGREGLDFTPTQQSLVLNAFPAAAIVAMFFSNQFADQNFAAERFLAFSHLVGGLSILALGWVHSFWPFFLLMLIHCFFYVPTISITNAIAFNAMRDAQREFGWIRLGGTLGWIAAAWPPVFLLVDWDKVRQTLADQNSSGLYAWLNVVFASGLQGEPLQAATTWTFVVAGVASLVLAAFSLVLPHTPPRQPQHRDVRDEWALLKAARLLAHPFVLVLWLVTLADSFIHNCFFNWTGRFLPTVGVPGNWVTPVMSIGQIAEILTMMGLGLVLKRLGWRLTLIIGVLGHAVRFGVFAFCPEHLWLIVAINVLHGICYAFFFAAVYIFVDEIFPKDVRSSAQGLFNVMILGVGAFLANFVCPVLFAHYQDAATQTVNYRALFLIPCVVSLIASAVLFFLFHPPRMGNESVGPRREA